MMGEYIIKNCPCYIDMPLHNHDKVCRLGGIVKPNHKELYVYCKDCTNCVMKCIKSKLDYLKCYINNDDLANLSKMNEIIDSMIQLLDIQEVE